MLHMLYLYIPTNLPNYKGSPFNVGTIKIVVTSDIKCPIQTLYIKYEGIHMSHKRNYKT